MLLWFAWTLNLLVESRFPMDQSCFNIHWLCDSPFEQTARGECACATCAPMASQFEDDDDDDVQEVPLTTCLRPPVPLLIIVS